MEPGKVSPPSFLPVAPGTSPAELDGPSQAALYGALLASLRDSVCLLDADGRLRFANPTALDLWGLSAAEAVGRNFLELGYPPDTADFLLGHVQQVFATASRVSGEIFFSSPTGATGFYEHIFSPLPDAEGNVVLVASATRDVTDRRRTEAALRATEGRMRLLSDLSELGRTLTDRDALMEIVVRKLGQHLKASFCCFSLQSGEDAGLRCCWGPSPPQGVLPELPVEHRVSTAVFADTGSDLGSSGALFVQAAIGALVSVPLFSDGELVATLWVGEREPREWLFPEVDLIQLVAERCWGYAEEARALRQLRSTFERLELAQQAGRVGVFDWDMVSGEVAWSPQLEDLYGLARGSFGRTLQSWAERVRPEDVERVSRILERAQAAQEADVSYDFWVLLPDGERRFMTAQSRFVYDGEGRAVRMIGVNVDDTERARAAEGREALLDSEREARAEAERVSRMKDEFLATLSHELRTPLNAILGWAQLLQGASIDPPVSADVLQGLETIERNARSQAQIIEDLLDMSRIISGKVLLNVQPLQLAGLLRDALDTARPAADAKGVELTAQLADLVGEISGDPRRLHQVFWNLLSNAVKFTPAGGHVQLSLARDSGSEPGWLVAVSDNGAGIGPDFLPFVFDRFRQADASSTRSHGGLGLGLSIVKQLTELHGGGVSVESEGVGRGSRFLVRLPAAAPAEPAARQPGGRSAPLREVELDGLQVLVVDDEPDVRSLLKRLLEDRGARVRLAGSAAEARAVCAEWGPQMLVSDIGMPGEDGFSLLRGLRSEGWNVPAVALTAYARREDRDKALAAGFQQHLTKPVEPNLLLQTVAELALAKAGHLPPDLEEAKQPEDVQTSPG